MIIRTEEGDWPLRAGLFYRRISVAPRGGYFEEGDAGGCFFQE